MKSLFLILVLANLLFYAAQQGYLGRIIPDGREPERLANQLAPEKISLLTPEQGARLEKDYPAKPAVPEHVACLEFGGFAGEDIKRAEAFLATLALGPRLSTRKADESANYLVYIPAQGSQAAANGKGAELKRLNISDFFIIQDNGPFKFAISLGVFKTEEAARNHLADLSQRGVKTARIGSRDTTVSKTWFQIKDVDAPLYMRLSDQRKDFPNADVKECPG